MFSSSVHYLLNFVVSTDCLKDIQPLEMTEWEREREKQEFERAAAIYKPLSGVMQSRFVSAKSHDISHLGNVASNSQTIENLVKQYLRN